MLYIKTADLAVIAALMWVSAALGAGLWAWATRRQRNVGLEESWLEHERKKQTTWD